MHFWTACSIFAITLSKVHAATSGHGEIHHASITDLFAPALNVGILIGVLVWKIKVPLRKYFISKAEEIANTLERASLKSKEAKLMLEGETRKMTNLNNEIKTILLQSENDVANFEKKLAKETEDKNQKLKIDANSKILADKKAMMDDLNSELLNRVILKTKTTIKSNKDYQEKVSSKLLQGL